MIVVRREDVLPGGRYAGGRFAPPVPEGRPRPRPVPSPRELRERAYQRIQDEGYLRAQRQSDPQAAAALATADAMDRFVAELTPLLAGFSPEDAAIAPETGQPGAAPPPLESMAREQGLAGPPGGLHGETRADAAEFDIAVWGLLRPFLQALLKGSGRSANKKPPAKGPEPQPPAPRRPDPESPAPLAPPKPDRPLSRAPDQPPDLSRDGLHEDPVPFETGDERADVPEIVLPDVSEVPDPDSMLLADEFDRMPETGLVDPNRIRTLQNTVGDRFKPEKGLGGQRSLVDTVTELRSGRTRPEDIPQILLFAFDGKIWTLDHRRVVAARLAGKPIRYRKATRAQIERQFDQKNSTETDGLSIIIRKSEK